MTRLHQEDLCQALGCLPDNKYTMYGGPNYAEALGLLTSTGPTAQTNAAGFLQMLFLNYLLAATDAHAKNYSIMLAADAKANTALGRWNSHKGHLGLHSLMSRTMQDAFRCNTNSDFLRRFRLYIQANGHMDRVQ